LVVSNVRATIWAYALALLIDVALFSAWLLLALRFSRRAARGELFDIPWIARITGTAVRK
jgi:hypothetical protein